MGDFRGRAVAAYHRGQDYLAARGIARQFAEQETWPAERMREFQQQRLNRLVRHAVRDSAFYRDLYAGIDVEKPVDITALPTVTKAELMANFDRAVTDDRLTLGDLESRPKLYNRVHLGRYLIFSSTGSSGDKGTYPLDRRERQESYAATMRRRSWIDDRPSRFGPGRFSEWGTTPGMKPKHGWMLDLVLRPTRVQRLDLRGSLAGWVEALNAFRPDRVWGIPSQIALLAAEQIDGRLAISPRVVTTCGEVCTAEMKARISEAWGVTPYDDWGCSEGGGMMAADCSYHRGLHLLEHRCIVEVVDEENRPVPTGTTGDKLLITNLSGYSLPRIRFEIPDFVRRLDEACPCGRTLPLIDVAQGRSEDALYLPGRRGGRVLIHPLHFRQHLASQPGIKEYQVAYDGAALTVLAVLRDGAVADGLVEGISATLRESLEVNEVAMPDVRVEIVDGDRIERDPRHRGKLKLIVDKRPRLGAR